MASSIDVDPTETSIFIARVAEQAECYENMLEFLEPIMVSKGANMSTEERTLVLVACKNLLEPLRRVWRTLLTIETYERFEKFQQYTDEYKNDIRDRFDKECQKIIDLINHKVLDQADEGTEGLAYFSKMKGDFYRYMLEVVKEDRLMQARDEANKAY